MKLTRRLTFYLLLAVGTVFGLDTYLSVRSHLALFDQDIRRDERVLGTALAKAVERTWAREGEAAARDLLRVMNANDAEISLRLVYLDSPRGEAQTPAAPPDAIAALRKAPVITHIRQEGEAVNRIFTYVPLAVGNAREPALEVSESLAHERRYAIERVRGTLVTAALALLACGGVVWGVGARVVGRPVDELVAKARRIARGDFSGTLHLPQAAELSQLAREMNAMSDSLEQAARRVASESAARLAALDQLRHADRLTTVGKLASGLAHELGTPLNVVAGHAKMLAAGELERPAERVESARVIASQAERMTAIVRQLLDFARRRSADKRPLELGVLARQSVSLLEPLAARAGVKLSCATGPAPIRADAAQIQQALTNLVMNAIQASARGSEVAVSVSSEPPDGSAGPGDGARAFVDVCDGGCGIPAERISLIFDPFFTTKPVGEGTGLGLSVAHGIVAEHGGRIDVESRPGSGSRFRISLPLESA